MSKSLSEKGGARATSPFSAATCRRKARRAGHPREQAGGLFHPDWIFHPGSKAPAIFVAWLLFGAASTIWARPAQIVLLRHAEKPADEKNPHLSPRGLERAHELVQRLTASRFLGGSNGPVVLVAPHPTPHARSVRCLETLQPTARQLQLTVESHYAAHDWSRLAQELLTNSAYDGKTVIICWVHDEIPALAAALGVKQVPSWSGKTFDRLWIITRAEGRAVLHDEPQHLLPGDSSP